MFYKTIAMYMNIQQRNIKSQRRNETPENITSITNRTYYQELYIRIEDEELQYSKRNK